MLVEDLQKWEQTNGRIPDGAIVIMNSGWTYRWPNKTLTFNTETPGDPSTFHFPGWHEDAVSWLMTNRNINVLGVDTPSNDYGMSTEFPVHVILGAHNISGVENVANLDAIPEAGTVISAGVIKLQDGSGGPVRMFAMLQDFYQTSSASDTYFSKLCVVLLALLYSTIASSLFG